MPQKVLRHVPAALFRPGAKNRERGQSPSLGGCSGSIGTNSLPLWSPPAKWLTDPLGSVPFVANSALYPSLDVENGLLTACDGTVILGLSEPDAKRPGVRHWR
jgi:hypothetical protein